MDGELDRHTRNRVGGKTPGRYHSFCHIYIENAMCAP